METVNILPPHTFPKISFFFVAIYLKDLTFFNDGNASKISNMINFEKLRMMADRVKGVNLLVGKQYKFDLNPVIMNYVTRPPVEKSMTKLKEQSLLCEPAEVK